MVPRLTNRWFSQESEAGILSDGELLTSMTEANQLEQQITQLFETLRQPVYQYLMAVFGNAEEAEDLTQDAFLQLYKTVKGGQVIRNIRFWIFRVAHNLAVNRRKHNQFIAPLDANSWEIIENLLPDTKPNPEQNVLLREKYERLYRGLKRLSMQERQALFLRAEGFRYREIGEIMSVATPTVGEFLRRGITKLSEQNGD
jgi:RNA polymerase sigma factor (sigma-70 family)